MNTARLTSVQLFWLQALIVVGVLLRFVEIGRSYWFDELYTVMQFAAPTFDQMLRVAIDDRNNPALFSILGWCWAQIFGYTELGTRALSMLFGLLVLVTPWLAKTALGRTEKWLAAALLALLYLPIRYAQETRVYSMMLFFSGCCLFCYLESLVTRLLRVRAVFAASLIIVAFSHIFGILLALSYLGIMFLFATRIRDRLRVAAFALVLAGCVIGPMVLHGVLLQAGGHFWIPFTLPWLLKQAIIVATPVGFGIFAYGCWSVPAERRAFHFRSPVVQAMLPTALLFSGTMLLSFHTPVIIARNLIVLMPAMALIGAWLLAASMRKNDSGVWMLAMLTALAAQSAVFEYLKLSFNPEDFRSIAQVSAATDQKVCYVVSDTEAHRLQPLYGFYVKEIIGHADLEPRLFDLSTVTPELGTAGCRLWAAIHVPGFAFTGRPQFANCMPIEQPVHYAPEIALSCPG